jgi:hypothetical protein
MGGEKFAQGFFGVLAADAGEQNCDAGFARRDFSKRRGFFFQGEANEQRIIFQRFLRSRFSQQICPDLFPVVRIHVGNYRSVRS